MGRRIEGDARSAAPQELAETVCGAGTRATPAVRCRNEGDARIQTPQKSTKTGFGSERNIRIAAAASPRPASTEYPRRGRGVAATRIHGIFASRSRRRRDPPPRNIDVVAPPPNLRLVAATPPPRNIRVVAAAAPRPAPAEYPRRFVSSESPARGRDRRSVETGARSRSCAAGIARPRSRACSERASRRPQTPWLSWLLFPPVPTT